jgi:carnitine O-palmitoyltransferase 2
MILFITGMILPPNVIMTHLNYILQDNRPPPELPVGVLTAENRDTWATVREQLLNAGINSSYYSFGHIL